MLLNNRIFQMLVGCFILWGALFLSTIESAVSIWYRSETFAHCFIILPICLYLLKHKWPLLSRQVPHPNYWILIGVIGIFVIWLFGKVAQVLVVEQGAAFLMLPAMIWTMLGNKAARIMIFPMMFWMFSVPVGEFLIPRLQELTADITVWALRLTDIPVYREGLYIAIPSGLFEVAVACSGIRYLIASFTLGTLYAYLNYQSIKKRTIFVLFSIALPLLANGIRAYGIVIIAHLSDMKYATGVDHLVYGWLFFGVVILIMFSVGNIWRDDEPEMTFDEGDVQPRMDVKRVGIALFGIGLVFLSARLYENAIRPGVSDFRPDVSPVFVTGPQVESAHWQPSYQDPSVEYSAHHEGVDYYIAYYREDLDGAELINSENRLFDIKLWSIVRQQNHGHFSSIEITNSRGQNRLLTFTFVTSLNQGPSQFKTKITQAIQAFFGQPKHGYVFVMSKAIQSKADNEELLELSRDKMQQPLSNVLGD